MLKLPIIKLNGLQAFTNIVRGRKSNFGRRNLIAHKALVSTDPTGPYGDKPLPDPYLLPYGRCARIVKIRWRDIGEPARGRVAAKIPFKMELEAGRSYRWCRCGISTTQPFCDGKHDLHNRLIHREFAKKPDKDRPRYSPMKFTVDETKEYYLCQCKRTKNAPFCDGTHRTLWKPQDGYVIKE